MNVAAGNRIESESFRIIRAELGETGMPEELLSVVIRVVHATGDFEYAKNLRFLSDIAVGVEALLSDALIITDVMMVKAGISKRFMPNAAERVRCRIDDPEVRLYAVKNFITRSCAAMRLDSTKLNGAIIAIGNAPTALLEVLRLASQEGIRPAYVIGVPVGFVSAAESKQELLKSSLPGVTSLGRKGGSSIAAAILNSLARMAYHEH